MTQNRTGPIAKCATFAEFAQAVAPGIDTEAALRKYAIARPFGVERVTRAEFERHLQVMAERVFRGPSMRSYIVTGTAMDALTIARIRSLVDLPPKVLHVSMRAKALSSLLRL